MVVTSVGVHPLKVTLAVNENVVEATEVDMVVEVTLERNVRKLLKNRPSTTGSSMHDSGKPWISSSRSLTDSDLAKSLAFLCSASSTFVV